MRANTLKDIQFCMVAAACGVAIAPALADNSKSVILAPGYTPGATHFVEMNDEIETFSRGGFYGEEGVTRKSTRLRTAKRTVKNGKGAVAKRLELTVDRVAMFTETAAAPASFDSDVDDPTDDLDPLAVSLGPMLGKTILFDVNAEGKVVEANGIDDLYFAVEEAAAGGSLFVQLEEELTESRIRFYWNASHACLYPNRTVKVGDTWKATAIQPSIYQKDILRTYKCKVDSIGERGGTEVVDVSYEVAMKEADDKTPKARLFGMSISLKDGKATGKVTYDVKRGEFVMQTEDMELNLTAVADAPGPSETTFVETRIKTVHTMTVVTEAQRKAQRKSAEKG